MTDITYIYRTCMSKILSWVRLQRQKVKERSQDILLPSNTLHLILDETKSFSGQSRCIIPSASLCLPVEISSQKDATKRHLDQMFTSFSCG